MNFLPDIIYREDELEQINDAYIDGFISGIQWLAEDDTVPGGPWMYYAGHNATNHERIRFEVVSRAANKEYLVGWRDGRKAVADGIFEQLSHERRQEIIATKWRTKAMLTNEQD